MDQQIEYFNDGAEFYEIDTLLINADSLMDFSIYERQPYTDNQYRFRCLLFDMDITKHAMQAILYHHENEDGSGYPTGLSHEQIPLIAKVCHIADVFDALTSRRHYKEPKTPFEALKIMTGDNPHLDTLKKFEQEVSENIKTPVSAIVRDDYDIKLRRLREREMIEQEALKRVEARVKLRDQGMSHCFDKSLLKRFIVTINRSESFELSDLLK